MSDMRLMKWVLKCAELDGSVQFIVLPKYKEAAS